MSFVGPRPERPYFVAQLAREIPFYHERHAVKPGLTGWAQVKYRYGASIEDATEKLRYDLYYVKHLSLVLRPHDPLRHGEGHPLRQGRAVTRVPAPGARPGLGRRRGHRYGRRPQRLHALPRLPRRRHPRSRHAALQPGPPRDGGVRTVDADDVVHRVFRDARPRLRRRARCASSRSTGRGAMHARSTRCSAPLGRLLRRSAP